MASRNLALSLLQSSVPRCTTALHPSMGRTRSIDRRLGERAAGRGEQPRLVTSPLRRAFSLSGSGQTPLIYFSKLELGLSHFGFLNAMQLFTVNITDLTEFDSPPCEEWLERDVVPYYAKLLARDVCRAMPDLLNKGMCIAVYDEAGLVISVVPLDSLH